MLQLLASDKNKVARSNVLASMHITEATVGVLLERTRDVAEEV